MNNRIGFTLDLRQSVHRNPHAYFTLECQHCGRSMFMKKKDKHKARRKYCGRKCLNNAVRVRCRHVGTKCTHKGREYGTNERRIRESLDLPVTVNVALDTYNSRNCRLETIGI